MKHLKYLQGIECRPVLYLKLASKSAFDSLGPTLGILREFLSQHEAMSYVTTLKLAHQLIVQWDQHGSCEVSES